MRKICIVGADGLRYRPPETPEIAADTMIRASKHTPRRHPVAGQPPPARTIAPVSVTAFALLASTIAEAIDGQYAAADEELANPVASLISVPFQFNDDAYLPQRALIAPFKKKMERNDL